VIITPGRKKGASIMAIALRLSLSNKSADHLCRHRLLQAGTTTLPHRQALVDTCFDTPDLRLRSSAQGPLLRRADRSHNINSASTALLNAALARRWLRIIFTAHIERTAWRIRLAQGTQLECVLERGYLIANGRKMPVCDIELRLLSGEPAQLFDFALALADDVALQLGSLTQSERGYALFAAQQLDAVKANLPLLSKRMRIEQAFQTLAINCLTQIQANIAGVTARSEAQSRYQVESVHQMRVGLRRLRTLLGLFKDYCAPPADLQQELDWLGTQLGPARDWDVLATSTLPQVAAAFKDQREDKDQNQNQGKDEDEDRDRFARLKLAVAAQAHQQHAVAARAVHARRFTQLMLRWMAWVVCRRWRDTLSRRARARLMAPISGLANAMLRQQQRLLHRRGKAWSNKSAAMASTAAARHRVRIAAKKMRYACEFFQMMYANGAIAPQLAQYVAALSRLQDQLGALNDAAIAGRLLDQLQHEQHELATCAGFLRGYLAATIVQDSAKSARLWQKLTPLALKV
jgi:triphosphatase